MGKFFLAIAFVFFLGGCLCSLTVYFGFCQSNYVNEKQPILGPTRGCRTINHAGVFAETQLTSIPSPDRCDLS